jgi:hypothetical protein
MASALPKAVAARLAKSTTLALDGVIGEYALPSRKTARIVRLDVCEGLVAVVHQLDQPYTKRWAVVWDETSGKLVTKKPDVMDAVLGPAPLGLLTCDGSKDSYQCSLSGWKTAADANAAWTILLAAFTGGVHLARDPSGMRAATFLLSNNWPRTDLDVLKLWRLEGTSAPELLHHVPSRDEIYDAGVAFSHDGTRLAAVMGKTLLCYSADGKPQAETAAKDVLVSVAWSWKDDRVFALARDGAQFKLYDAKALEPVRERSGTAYRYHSAIGLGDGGFAVTGTDHKGQDRLELMDADGKTRETIDLSGLRAERTALFASADCLYVGTSASVVLRFRVR